MRLEAVYRIKRSSMNELREELKHEQAPYGQTGTSKVTLTKK
ncbi:hypothetical protein [Bacillus haynesii]|nr:hypothetical protein [Bacillus haynesii]